MEETSSSIPVRCVSPEVHKTEEHNLSFTKDIPSVSLVLLVTIVENPNISTTSRLVNTWFPPRTLLETSVRTVKRPSNQEDNEYSFESMAEVSVGRWRKPHHPFLFDALSSSLDSVYRQQIDCRGQTTTISRRLNFRDLVAVDSHQSKKVGMDLDECYNFILGI
ncbi:hypothetical protein J6590_061611 [Homalodisca vitripennis]|nr:hypothetical protein J6590_061611 [Homalodisca vitripennis]